MTEFRETYSPWGTIDGKEQIAEGIWQVSTPSHGGFWLSPERLAKVPVTWRAARWNNTDIDSPWFEEDSDSCLVILTFPEAFNPQAVEAARSALKWGIESEFSQYHAGMLEGIAA